MDISTPWLKRILPIDALGRFMLWALMGAVGLGFGALPVQAGPCDAPSMDEGPADLERLFDEHSYAFVARVEAVLRPGVLAAPEVSETTELSVFQPALKGTVPGALSFQLENRCIPDFSEGAVYLIFSNNLARAPAPADVRAMLAYESGPYIEWIAQWVDNKHRNEPLLQDLSDLQWQHRLLLIAGEDATADTLTELRGRRDDIDDRDLLWWIAVDDDLYSNYPGRISPALKQRLLLRDGSQQASVVLIGKDGSTKLDLRYFDLDRILSRIDSMPMRAGEMRDR